MLIIKNMDTKKVISIIVVMILPEYMAKLMSVEKSDVPQKSDNQKTVLFIFALDKTKYALYNSNKALNISTILFVFILFATKP